MNSTMGRVSRPARKEKGQKPSSRSRVFAFGSTSWGQRCVTSSSTIYNASAAALFGGDGAGKDLHGSIGHSPLLLEDGQRQPDAIHRLSLSAWMEPSDFTDFVNDQERAKEELKQHQWA